MQCRRIDRQMLGPNPCGKVLASRRHCLKILAGTAVLSITGCHASLTNKIKVFAASSLVKPLNTILNQYRYSDLDTEVAVHYGGSNNLKSQIELGAPADVYISADPHLIRALTKGHIVSGSPSPIASNYAAILAPMSSSSRVRTIHDLTKTSVRIAMAGPNVPAGRLARDLLQNLSLQNEFGSNFTNLVHEKIISHETSARGVVSKILLGEVDAGFAFQSDSHNSKKIRNVSLPKTALVGTSYLAAAVSRENHAAQKFVDYLTTPTAESEFTRNGFGAPYPLSSIFSILD